MFGLVLTVVALFGLAVSWRRRSAWQLAALWLGSAWLALGATLYVFKVQHVPFQQIWNGVRVSPVMPYTWVMRLPVLSAFREADRFAILGLVGAALLAGAAVDWLRYHARPVIVVVAALAVLEAGSTGLPKTGLMPAALPALDHAIAADHSGSIVLDVPFGLRGGIPQYGKPSAPPALVLATADGHPRAISYTSWVPPKTAAGILAHPFYAQLTAGPVRHPAGAGSEPGGPPGDRGRARRGQGRPEPSRHRLGPGLGPPVAREPAGGRLPAGDRLPVRLPDRPRPRVQVPRRLSAAGQLRIP